MIGVQHEEEVAVEAMSDTESDFEVAVQEEIDGKALADFITKYIQDPEEPRRWKKSPTEEYFTFKEWVKFCSERDYQKQTEDKAFSTLEGAKFIWDQSIPLRVEVQQAQQAKEDFKALREMDLQALRKGDKRSVVLQTLSAKDLRGPKDGGLALHVAHRGGADVWGGLDERSVHILQVVDVQPTLQVVLRSFTGRTLYHDSWKNQAYPQISFHGWDDPRYEEMIFELVPRADPVYLDKETARRAYALAPKMLPEGPIIGTFTVLEAPDRLARHRWTLNEDLEKEMRLAAVKQMKEDGFLTGRRQLKDDFAGRWMDFEAVVIYAAKKYLLPEIDDAIECSRTIWKFMAKDEDEAHLAKRPRQDGEWNLC